MHSMIIAIIASLAGITIAAPSNIYDGTVVAGPAGIVTNHGAIGPINHNLGYGLDGLSWGGIGLAHGVGPYAAAPVYGHAGLNLGHGGAVVTNGGGVISVSDHGATVSGPPTVPVVIAGPAGKVTADGLWGPTGNVGLGYGHGHGW